MCGRSWRSMGPSAEPARRSIYRRPVPRSRTCAVSGRGPGAISQPCREPGTTLLSASDYFGFEPTKLCWGDDVVDHPRSDDNTDLEAFIVNRRSVTKYTA
jgi:hypothetical protein